MQHKERERDTFFFGDGRIKTSTRLLLLFYYTKQLDNEMSDHDGEPKPPLPPGFMWVHVPSFCNEGECQGMEKAHNLHKNDPLLHGPAPASECIHVAFVFAPMEKAPHA